MSHPDALEFEDGSPSFSHPLKAAIASDEPRAEHEILYTSDGALSPNYLRALAGSASRLNKDLSEPAIPYYGQLRLYSMQHITQELNYLRIKAFKDINISREELERLRFLLHEQVKAMKDLEYLNEHLEAVSEGRFEKTLKNIRSYNLSIDSLAIGWLYTFPKAHSTTSRLLSLLITLLPRRITWSSGERKRDPHYYATGKRPTEPSIAVRIIGSVIISVASGASIIVPMIIMSFDGGRTKSLIVVSVAVLLFGFVLAAVIRVRSENVFLATASYAAVLVVFVGANGTAASGTSV